MSNSVFGQTEFDYHTLFKVILEQSADSSSEYYAPKLLTRFNENDSTLTNIEIIALQIGFTSNENYKPYQTLEIERDIIRLVSNEEYEEAIKKSDSLLITNPLNFTALLLKALSYVNLKKEDAEFHKGKFKKIVYSIMSSGNGTIEKPYFVLGPGDGSNLIKYVLGGKIGMAGSQDDSNGYFCDMLEMTTKKETKTLYFNINHATEKMFSKEVKEQIKKVELKIKNGG
jgi:hypothetical protein